MYTKIWDENFLNFILENGAANSLAISFILPGFIANTAAPSSLKASFLKSFIALSKSTIFSSFISFTTEKIKQLKSLYSDQEVLLIHRNVVQENAILNHFGE